MILYTNKHKIPFQVDDEQVEKVIKHSWYLNKYLKTHLPSPHGQLTVLLHIFLFGRAPNGLQWDHHNQDKLDNRRENLRLVNNTINQRNVGLRKTNTSGAKGVNWNEKCQLWYVNISVPGDRIHIGAFPTFEEAVEARKEAEQIFWGDQR